MDNPWEYRNKAQFPVGLVKDELTIGFYAARSHDIVGIDSCDIQHNINNELLDLVKRFIQDKNIPTYDEKHIRELSAISLQGLAIGLKS